MSKSYATISTVQGVPWEKKFVTHSLLERYTSVPWHANVFDDIKYYSLYHILGDQRGLLNLL